MISQGKAVQLHMLQTQKRAKLLRALASADRRSKNVRVKSEP
jgi:hypothetical protein